MIDDLDALMDEFFATMSFDEELTPKDAIELTESDEDPDED